MDIAAPGASSSPHASQHAAATPFAPAKEQEAASEPLSADEAAMLQSILSGASQDPDEDEQVDTCGRRTAALLTKRPLYGDRWTLQKD